MIYSDMDWVQFSQMMKEDSIDRPVNCTTLVTVRLQVDLEGVFIKYSTQRQTKLQPAETSFMEGYFYFKSG